MSDPTTPPARFVLEGVPRVGFYPKQSTGAPEDFSLPACMRATLEYLNDDIYSSWLQHHPAFGWHVVHQYFVAISGLAFMLAWTPDKWENVSWRMFEMASDPLQPIRSAMEASGYAHEILLRGEWARELQIKDEGNDDESLYRRRIIESIQNNRPVLAIGVVGPPEISLITGCDDRGDVLIGWSFFQDDPAFQKNVVFEPSGYFRKREWFQDTQGIILFGEKTGRPDRLTMYREALRRGLAIMRTPEVRGNAGGIAAFDAWEAAVRNDEAFKTDDEKALRQQHFAHHDTAGYLAEARAWGQKLFNIIAAEYPDTADEMNKAAECFRTEHDLVWAIWEFAKGDEGWKTFQNSHVRQTRIAPLIHHAQTQDKQAAEYIEKALTKLDHLAQQNKKGE